MGAARALDVEDYDPEEQSLRIRHRPETGTPIKNKQRGERMLATPATSVWCSTTGCETVGPT